MSRISICCLMILVTVGGVALAQTVDEAEMNNMKKDYLGMQPAAKPFSLIDLSRLQWSHSYSVTYFSGSDHSGSMGMYAASVFYELSPALSLDILLGIAHDPGALFNQNTPVNAAYYPSIHLDYHPSNNFRVSVGFVSHPGFYNPYYFNKRYDW